MARYRVTVKEIVITAYELDAPDEETAARLAEQYDADRSYPGQVESIESIADVITNTETSVVTYRN